MRDRKAFERFFTKFGIPYSYEEDSDPSGRGCCSSLHVKNIEFMFIYPNEIFDGIYIKLDKVIRREKKE